MAADPEREHVPQPHGLERLRTMPDCRKHRECDAFLAFGARLGAQVAACTYPRRRDADLLPPASDRRPDLSAGSGDAPPRRTSKPCAIARLRPAADRAVSRLPGQLARFDLGRSVVQNVPVTTIIASRLPYTLQLAGGALLVACGIGIPVGILLAVYREQRRLHGRCPGSCLRRRACRPSGAASC